MATSKSALLKMDSRDDTSFYQFDPQIGFWGIPNVKKEVLFPQRNMPMWVCHNEEGNRDEPLDGGGLNAKGGLLCIGGSHTWGGGIEQELRYPNLLQTKTGKRVVNMGHCSLGLDQICLAILNRSSSYSPSIIIVEQYPWAIHRVLNTYVNGFTRPYFYLDAHRELRLKKMPRLTRIPLFRKIIGSYYLYLKELNEFRAGINLKEGYNPSIDPIFLSWKTHFYDYMYELVEKMIAVLQDYCHQNGIKLLFALGAIIQYFGQPSPSALIDFDLPRNRLIHILEKNCVHYVDMKEPMLNQHMPIDPVIFEDGHINVKGHALFAEIIFKKLQKLGWLTHGKKID